jgi:hypothetical protein
MEIDFKSGEFKYFKNFALTNKEIEVLDKYNINYNNCNSTSELIYKIETILNQEDFNDLEDIEEEISERDYYANTNK